MVWRCERWSLDRGLWVEMRYSLEQLAIVLRRRWGWSLWSPSRERSIGHGSKTESKIG
jgi:hypothetical protein